MYYAYELQNIMHNNARNYLNTALQEIDDKLLDAATRGEDRVEICLNFLCNKTRVAYWSDEDCNYITNTLRTFGYEIISVRKEHPNSFKVTLYYVTIKW